MDGPTQQGPFTLHELISLNLASDTYVYSSSGGEWKKLKEYPELNLRQGPAGPTEPTPQPTVGRGSYSPVPPKPQSPVTKSPKSWLVESILVTLFCCLPFGIAGIINAAKVESRFYAGDVGGAIRASEEAEKWTKISFWIGLVISVVYTIAMIV